MLFFEKKVEAIEWENDKEHISCEFLLSVDGEIFDPEEDYRCSNSLRDKLFEQYLIYFSDLCPEGYVTAIKLSGLHIDYVALLKDYVFTEDSRNHVIFHYHHWKVDESEVVDENAYLIIKANSSLFKDLFAKYWFSFDSECHFEGIVMSEEDSAYLEKWSRLDENDSKKNAMINSALLIFDNLYNGFHFKISTDKKSSDFFDSALPTGM